MPLAAGDRVVAAIAVDGVAGLRPGDDIGIPVPGVGGARDRHARRGRGGRGLPALLGRGDGLEGIVGLLALAVRADEAEPVLGVARAAADVLIGVPQDRSRPAVSRGKLRRLGQDRRLGGLGNGVVARGRGAELGHPDLQVGIAVRDHGAADAVLHDLPAVPGVRGRGQIGIGIGMVADGVEIPLAAVRVDRLQIVDRAIEAVAGGGHGRQAAGDDDIAGIDRIDGREGPLEQGGVVRGGDAAHVRLVPDLPVVDAVPVMAGSRRREFGEGLAGAGARHGAVGPGRGVVQDADHLDPVFLRRRDHPVHVRPGIAAAGRFLRIVPADVDAQPVGPEGLVVGQGRIEGRGRFRIEIPGCDSQLSRDDIRRHFVLRISRLLYVERQ